MEVVQELTDEDVGAEVDDLEAEERDEGKMGEVRRVMGDLIDELVSVKSLLESGQHRVPSTSDSRSGFILM